MNPAATVLAANLGYEYRYYDITNDISLRLTGGSQTMYITIVSMNDAWTNYSVCVDIWQGLNHIYEVEDVEVLDMERFLSHMKDAFIGAKLN